MRKIFWVGLAVIAVALAGYWIWARNAGSSTAARPATYVVSRGVVEQNVLATGQLEASSLVSVGAQVSGEIETLAVKLGQRVAQGDLIAQINSLEQQNEVARAQAGLKKIAAQITAKEASIRVAELYHDRQRALHERGSATQEVLESAAADLEVLRAERQQLEAELTSAQIAVASAELALGRTQITAPIAGTVVAIVTEQGQTVNANQSTPTIVKLAQLDRMVVKAEISEADVIRVRPGQEASFSILGEPGQVFSARVRDIEPAPAAIRDSDTISTEAAVYYSGLFDVDNPDHRLRIGMTTEVSIQLARAEDVLILPSAALGRRNGDGSYTVMVYNPATGASAPRQITAGLNNNITAEIVAGLNEGEHVLASGAAAGLDRATVNMGRRPSVLGF